MPLNLNMPGIEIDSELFAVLLETMQMAKGTNEPWFLLRGNQEDAGAYTIMPFDWWKNNSGKLGVSTELVALASEWGDLHMLVPVVTGISETRTINKGQASQRAQDPQFFAFDGNGQLITNEGLDD